MFRGTVAAGVATAGLIGAVAVGEEIGAAGGAAAFKGSIGQTANTNDGGFYVKHRHSLVFYASELSADAGTATIVLRVTGEDLDGNTVFENVSLGTTNGVGATQCKPTRLVYRKITSIKVQTLSGSAIDPAKAMIAIGHGVTLLDTNNNFRPRFAISAKVRSVKEIAYVLSPDGVTKLPVNFDPTSTHYGADFPNHVLIFPDGNTITPGEYVVYYSDNLGYGDYL